MAKLSANLFNAGEDANKRFLTQCYTRGFHVMLSLRCLLACGTAYENGLQVSTIALLTSLESPLQSPTTNPHERPAGSTGRVGGFQKSAAAQNAVANAI